MIFLPSLPAPGVSHTPLCHLKLCLRIGSIYHMNDIICILSLFQRTFKRFYQMMWQLADKSYSICQKDLLPSLSSNTRVVGSNVANSLSSARMPAPVSVFKSVDFPAFV